MQQHKKTRGKNTRVQLTLNTVIWRDVVAESEAMGFSLSEIVDRALLAQGYGKITASAAKPVEAKPIKPPPQWDDETEDEHFERFTVETGLETHPLIVARILARYRAHGLSEIIYRDPPKTSG